MQTTSTTGLLARARLEERVEAGRKVASSVVSRVLSEIPQDAIARAPALRFQHEGNRLTLTAGSTASWDLHRHALGQVAEKAGIPITYVNHLDAAGEGEDWRRELLVDNLSRLFGHQPDNRRYLVRSVKGQARGFLSDKYRRFDSRVTLEAFLGEAQKHGAVAVEGHATDIRSSLKVILPNIIEPVPNEFVVYGLEWHDSQYGGARYSVRGFTLRLVCLNGMVGEDSFAQVHLGAKLPDHIEFSQKTYELDTATMVSATKDVVRGALSEASIAKMGEAVQRAAGQEVSFAQAIRGVSAALTKQEISRAKDAFEGEDVVMLPPQQTTWRFSNVLSLLANQTDDVDRTLELQRLAGSAMKPVATGKAGLRRTFDALAS